MLEYTAQTTQKVSACVCDRCTVRLTPDDTRWQEGINLSWLAGYASVFGDGNTVSIDLCQDCVKAVLGPWLRISGPEA